MSDGTPSSACGSSGLRPRRPHGDVARLFAATGMTGSAAKRSGWPWGLRGVDAGARSASDRGDRLRIAEPQGGGRGGPRQARCRGRGPALQGLLGDQRADVRRHALVCLRQLGPTAAEAAGDVARAFRQRG